MSALLMGGVTEAAVLFLDADAVSDSGKCPACCGWGFTWVSFAGAEPVPGVDCRDCHGSGLVW
ncbi:hypothetical protein [Kitasatospora herbaricolor]|uniref:hypothetical protein n=1 Tax=Kitasatospora herbaricolor TaxID=68217 RepID=UPI0036DE9863